MAEGFTAPFAKDILQSLLTILADEAKLAWGYKAEVKRLERRLRRTLAFLSDAETKSPVSERTLVWLNDLKAAVNEAVAVVDEFRYEELRKQIQVRGRFNKKVTDFFSSSHNPLAFRLHLADKVQRVNSLLDDIKKEALDLHLEEKIVVSPPLEPLDITPKRIIVTGVDIKSVVGRVEEVSIVVDQLLSSADGVDLPVISICGMGGLGKTTLAHLVCMDDRVATHFHAKIVITVSTDFKVTRLLNEMAQSLTKNNPNLSNDGALIDLLSQEIKGKRYLLILDDVWSTDPILWNSMRTALLGIKGSLGSKIIVTCRDKDVASTMQSSFTHDLSGLSLQDGWILFGHKAFASGGPVETPELVAIGKDIVKNCAGVPLAIDVLGSLMHSMKTEAEWLAVRDNRSLSLEKNINFVQNVLKLSYDHLSPSSLKSCFAFMSILPKNSYLEKDLFVQLWMALGLLPPLKNRNLNLEDVGSEYFGSLVAKSLLHEAEFDDYGNIVGSKMHDLVHDLALRTAQGYCVTLSDSNEAQDIPDHIMHLCLISPPKEQIDLARKGFWKLQTLIFVGSLPENIIGELKCLRILVLEDNESKELPASIGKLKHLRLLDISGTSIVKLPSSFIKLYNLQTLRAKCVREFPKRFGDLVSLRHIHAGGIIAGVGKLTQLQTLSLLKVSRDGGCLVGELGGLVNLKGKLAIEGLEQVRNVEEASSAKLVEKSNIRALKFQWKEEDAEEGFIVHEHVLEGLRPHSNLKSLKIEGFSGVKLGSWMTSGSLMVLKNLVKIKLEGLGRCEQVPTLGHLPNLKQLEMAGLKRVRKMGQEFYYHRLSSHEDDVMVFFPALKTLVLQRMRMLEEWVDVKQDNQSLPSSSSVNKVFQFPNLEKLIISYCGNLKMVPSQFPSLKELRVEGIWNSRLELQKMTRGLTRLTDVTFSDVDCEMESALIEMFENNSKSLAFVYISNCPELRELRENLFKDCDCAALKELCVINCSNIKVISDVGALTSLQDLTIYRCGALECLPRGMDTLMSLRSLIISNCRAAVGGMPDLGNLKRLETLTIGGFCAIEIPRLPTSLGDLFLDGWLHVKELPHQQLGHLSALRRLTLKDMKALEALPEWLRNLPSLQRLHISGCRVLSERCVKGSGTDWHKIQHIPFILIDGQFIQKMD